MTNYFKQCLGVAYLEPEVKITKKVFIVLMFE